MYDYGHIGAIIIVFDVCSREDFEKIDDLIYEIRT